MISTRRLISQRLETLESRVVPTFQGNQIFPLDNPWNQVVSGAPVSANSKAIIDHIVAEHKGTAPGLHPDFGNPVTDEALYGIPINVVDSTVAKVPVFIPSAGYADESDLVNVPIPADASSVVIEGDGPTGPAPSKNRGDSHLLIYDKSANILYELYQAIRPSETKFPEGATKSVNEWGAYQISVWDLNANTFRTIGDTSADAAGLPIMPGLVRPDEALPVSEGGQGVIDHAIRMTVQQTRDMFVYPASHAASSSDDSDLPRMGERFRLKASFVIPSNWSPETKAIAQAMKTYGMIVADNGSDMYFSGTPSDEWNMDSVLQINAIKATDFEVIDLTPVVTGLSVKSGSADGGTSVTITGNNFTEGLNGQLQVFFGTTPAASVTVVSNTQIIATTPAHALGATDVFVQSGSQQTDKDGDPVFFGPGKSSVVAADKFTFTTPPPTLTVSLAGPGDAVRGLDQTFTANIIDLDTSATQEIRWDYGDGTVSDWTPVTGADSLVSHHAYANTGSDTVTVSVRDSKSRQATSTLGVAVKLAVIRGSDLLVGGSTGNDLIVLTPQTAANTFAVKLNNVAAGTFVIPGGIQLLGNGGTDAVTVNGTAGSDTITTGPDMVQLNGRSITGPGFASWQILALGGNDTITLGGGAITKIDGGVGIDRLNAQDTDNSWTVNTSTTATLNGISLVGVETLAGGAGADTFTMNTPIFSGSLLGGAGNDSLTRGTAGNNSWYVTGPKQGSLNSITTSKFSDIETLIGSSLTNYNDTLISLPTVITTPVTWSLTGAGSGSVAGTAFNGFEALTGGARSPDTFQVGDGATLKGTMTGGTYAGVTDKVVNQLTADGTWTMTGAGAGNLNAVKFAGMEELDGSDAADRFVMGTVGSVAGKIIGNGGLNTLDYSARVAAVKVNLATGTSTSAVLGISGISVVLGGKGADSLTGGAGDDILVGGNGNDTLTGGDGNDLLIGGLGIDNIHGGNGFDILVAGAVSFQTNAVALDGLRFGWTTNLSAATYADHVALVRDTGVNGFLLNGTTISETPVSIDSLSGEADLDWFATGTTDKVLDLSVDGETRNNF
ncbi:beta strand repeat-containing protein [Zavarzinella formosa]|uniref:beta strand repeat-containing protein n=1 Tax=Zavarzinella formosa TaxID=360055 RepID=UPI0003171C35|nr:IPT/TIG domain-containing protein [Zavarzinella formosa]